jgi:hypothetical protein
MITYKVKVKLSLCLTYEALRHEDALPFTVLRFPPAVLSKSYPEEEHIIFVQCNEKAV